MDPGLGEVVDEHEEVARAQRRAARAATRANHRAQLQERRRRLAAMIMAEHNSNDVKQFKEAFPEGMSQMTLSSGGQETGQASIDSK